MNKQSMNKYVRSVAQSFINNRKKQRRKNWIAVSLSLLMSIGLGAITSHSVHAANDNNNSTKSNITVVTSSGTNKPTTSKAPTSILNNQSLVSSSINSQNYNNVVYSSSTIPISSSSNIQSVSNPSILSKSSKSVLFSNSQSNTYSSQVLSIKNNAVSSAINNYNNDYLSSNVLPHSPASTNVDTINQQAKAVASGVIRHLQADNDNQSRPKISLGGIRNLETSNEQTSVNVNYMNGSQFVGSQQIQGKPNTSVSPNQYNIPNGYQAMPLELQKPELFPSPNNSTPSFNIAVQPISNSSSNNNNSNNNPGTSGGDNSNTSSSTSDTYINIKYMYNGQLEGSQQIYGKPNVFVQSDQYQIPSKFKAMPLELQKPIVFPSYNSGIPSDTVDVEPVNSDNTPTSNSSSQQNSGEAIPSNSSSSSSTSAPSKYTVDITYSDNGNNIKTITLSGPNGSNAKDQIDQNCPNGYHVTNGDNWTFWNGTDNSGHTTQTVQVEQNSVSDTVSYQYNGQQIGNLVNINGTPNTSAQSQIDSDVPSRYHIVSSDDKNFYSPSMTFNVNIAPNQLTDQINYVLEKQNIPANDNQQAGTLGSTSLTGDSDTNINNTTYNNLPNHYHIVGNPNLTYDGKAHNVDIAPDSMTENITYDYSDDVATNNVGKTGKLGSDEISGYYDCNVQNSDLSKIPNYYHPVTPLNISYDGQNHTIQLAPDMINQNLTYNLSGNGIPTNYVSTAKRGNFNTIQVSGLYETKSDTTGLQDIPTNYHIMPNQSFVYSTQPQDIQITPSQINENVAYNLGDTPNNYVGKTGTLGNTTISGLYETTVNNNELTNIPQYYHIVGTPSLVYDSTPQTVKITPSQISEPIHYMMSQQNEPKEYEGKAGQLNSININGLYETTVDNSSLNNVPTYYHIVGTPSLVYDVNEHNVQIAPSNVTNIIQYQLNQPNIPNEYVGKTGQLGQTTITKPYETKVDMSDYNQIPQYYHIVTNPNLVYDNLTHPVQITPSKVTNSITYNVSPYDVPINYAGKTGNIGHTKITSYYNTKVNPNDLINIPQYYHLFDNPNLVYDNQDHTAQIVPSLVINHIYYVINGKNIPANYVGKTGQLGDNLIQGTYETKINNNDYTKVPNGYHIVGIPDLIYDNSAHQVGITPNNETIDVNYHDINHKGVITETGNDNQSESFTAPYNTKINDVTSKASVPNGYHLHGNPDKSYTVALNDNKKNFDISGNKHTVKINYVLPKNEKLEGTNKSSFYIKGRTGTSKKITVPKGYHTQDNLTYHFNPSNNKNKDIHIQGNQIKGTATLTLRYKNPNGKTIKTVKKHIPINSYVGSKPVIIDPKKYNLHSFKSTSAPWIIPMDWRLATKGNNVNYKPTETFTYVSNNSTNHKLNGSNEKYYGNNTALIPYHSVNLGDTNYNIPTGNISNNNDAISYNTNDETTPENNISNGNLDDESFSPAHKPSIDISSSNNNFGLPTDNTNNSDKAPMNSDSDDTPDNNSSKLPQTNESYSPIMLMVFMLALLSLGVANLRLYNHIN